MRLLTVAVGVALTGLAVSVTAVSAQSAAPSSVGAQLRLPGPDRTLLDVAPVWRVSTPGRQGETFRADHRHWSWLFPNTPVATFGSDPLLRRHWWADPLLRRHWWR